MSTNLNPTCTTDCTCNLPDNKINYCRSAVHTGEIEFLYVACYDAQCFSDWNVLAEWNARISETSNDPDAIRKFRVIGTMPVAAPNETVISMGEIFYDEPERVINIEIEDLPQENYDFWRQMQCGGKMKIWFQTAGGDLFGGNCGLDVSTTNGLQIEAGQRSLHKVMVTAKYFDQFSPERTVSPMA